MRKSLAERFWEKVDVQGENDCWNWIAQKSGNGRYGAIKVGGKRGCNIHAHRVAWELANGPIPDGLCVCHSCDNGFCVNPKHLWLGTHMENMIDRDRKGRNINHRGSMHGMAKLTESDVLAIRGLWRSGRSQTEIARDFPVTKHAIFRIVNRRTWKHLP